MEKEERDLTELRKQQHVEKALLSSSQYNKTTLLEEIDFIHSSLPELDWEKTDVRASLFGRKFSLPLLITGMTGGYKKAREINIELAKAASSFNIPFGVGSQRAMIENKDLLPTYDVKKEVEDLFLIANIGAYQLKVYSNSQIESLVKDIDANALAIHLNPLQEIIQPEGDRDWENVLFRIGEVVDYLDVPVLIKETGAGISREVASSLASLGIELIDVSGAGGTSWSKIEYMRGGAIKGFEEWGIPTALSILLCRDVVDVIASGGIRSGIDGAKALALGARFFGSAKPFLQAVYEKRVFQLIEEWKNQLKTVLFLTGTKDIEEFRKKRPIIVGEKLYFYAKQLGVKI